MATSQFSINLRFLTVSSSEQCTYRRTRSAGQSQNTDNSSVRGVFRGAGRSIGKVWGLLRVQAKPATMHPYPPPLIPASVPGTQPTPPFPKPCQPVCFPPCPPACVPSCLPVRIPPSFPFDSLDQNCGMQKRTERKHLKVRAAQDAMDLI